MVELVYKIDKKSYREMFEKVSRLLKYDSNFFLSTNIYTHTYIWTLALITLSRLCCVCGVMIKQGKSDDIQNSISQKCQLFLGFLDYT